VTQLRGGSRLRAWEEYRIEAEEYRELDAERLARASR
jgi:hypothetical protein